MSGRSLADVYHQAEALGIVVDSIEADGTWHRIPVAGKRSGNRSGAYCLSVLLLSSGAEAYVGMLYNWASGLEERLTLEGIAGATPEEIAEARRRAKAAAQAARAAKVELQQETAVRALNIWNKLHDEGGSAYLAQKGVRAWGVRFSRGSVVVPARDGDGKLWTLQFIDANGNKRFLTGGKKRGCFHQIGRPEGAHLLGVSEGYATAATLFELQDIPVAVAFDAGNLLPVAQRLRRVQPSARIVIFADHDQHNGYPQAFIRQSEATPAVREQIQRLQAARPDVAVEVVADEDPRLKDRDRHHNTGVAKAILAAAAIDGDVVVPKITMHVEETGE